MEEYLRNLQQAVEADFRRNEAREQELRRREQALKLEQQELQTRGQALQDVLQKFIYELRCHEQLCPDERFTAQSAKQASE